MRSSKDGADEASVPSRLESARAKLVYLALATDGPASVDDLAARLGETRLALLAVLATLEERGLVARGADGFAVA
ncbi:MAG: TrmB family transcriptional regulator [Haloferacaceae archaeon]